MLANYNRTIEINSAADDQLNRLSKNVYQLDLLTNREHKNLVSEIIDDLLLMRGLVGAMYKIYVQSAKEVE